MEKTCRDCRFISKGKDHCPVCNSESLTPRWTGLLYIVNPEESEMAKELGIKVPGRHAAKIKE